MSTTLIRPRAPVSARARGAHAFLAAWLLAVCVCPCARAFDIAAYKARLDQVLSELAVGTVPEATASLAHLDEMIDIGSHAAAEYAAGQPRYGRLMAAVVADAPAMRAMTSNELEDKWGERGSGGDAQGVPLTTLDQFGEQRAYMEMVIAPATVYAFVSRWKRSNKAFWLEEARDEMAELRRRLEFATGQPVRSPASESPGKP